MALWGDRMALFDENRGEVKVVDAASGVQLHTFGKHGTGPGEFAGLVVLCAHPNGNLLVLEGSDRVQEVTWTGDHVRFIYCHAINGYWAHAVDVSPNGSLIALVTGTQYRSVLTTIELLDERTCACVARIRSPDASWGPFAIRFSPCGFRVVATSTIHKPAMFHVHVRKTNADASIEVGRVFGAAPRLHEYQHVEFTDEGDVVVATHDKATVYSGTALEPVRSWTWPPTVRCVRAIQAHRGLLYVACNVGEAHNPHVHVYQ